MDTSITEPRTAWNAEAVADFANGNLDILVLERHHLADVSSAVESGRIHEYLAPISREKVSFEVRGGLGELRIKSPELTEDISGLATSFLDQFDLEHARMRIEVTRTQSCPKFHSDNVNIRLVTTYAGPATEYQFAGETTVQRAPVGGLVFLKGSRNPTHRDSIHHRSPEVPDGEKRLCVAIDY
ncbi:MAG: DUF1826 domain-containing protein [Planctomycetota bacterium]